MIQLLSEKHQNKFESYILKREPLQMCNASLSSISICVLLCTTNVLLFDILEPITLLCVKFIICPPARTDLNPNIAN